MKIFNLKFIVILLFFCSTLKGQIISDPLLILSFIGDVETAIIDDQVLKNDDIQNLDYLINVEKRFPYKRYDFNRIGLPTKIVTYKSSSDSVTTKYTYEDNIISQKSIFNKQQNVLKTINYTYRYFTRKLIYTDDKGYTKSVVNYDKAGRLVKIKSKNLETKQKNIGKRKYKEDRIVRKTIISNKGRLKQFLEYDKESGRVIQIREYTARAKPYRVIDYQYSGETRMVKKIKNLSTNQISIEMIETLEDEFGNEILIAVKNDNEISQFSRTVLEYYNSEK